MYILDYLYIAFIFLGAWKGSRRGIEPELKSLISTLLLLSLLSGVWVFAVVREAISELLKIHPMLAGISSAVLAFILAIMLMRMLRNHVPEAVARSVGQSSSVIWGIILGAFRRSVLGGFLLFVTASAPIGLINNFVVGHSVAGYWIDHYFVIKDEEIVETVSPGSEPNMTPSTFNDPYNN